MRPKTPALTLLQVSIPAHAHVIDGLTFHAAILGGPGGGQTTLDWLCYRVIVFVIIAIDRV